MEGDPSERGRLFVDMKLKVSPLYTLLILKRNSYFNVNKRLSATRWAYLYKFDILTESPFRRCRRKSSWTALIQTSLRWRSSTLSSTISPPSVLRKIRREGGDRFRREGGHLRPTTTTTDGRNTAIAPTSSTPSNPLRRPPLAVLPRRRPRHLTGRHQNVENEAANTEMAKYILRLPS